MAVNVKIANGNASALSNVNAGGDDVAAYTLSGTISMSAAELETLFATDGVVVINANSDSAEAHMAVKVLKLGTNPGQ